MPTTVSADVCYSRGCILRWIHSSRDVGSPLESPGLQHQDAVADQCNLKDNPRPRSPRMQESEAKVVELNSLSKFPCDFQHEFNVFLARAETSNGPDSIIMRLSKYPENRYQTGSASSSA